jgi:hypothetical protein
VPDEISTFDLDPRMMQLSGQFAVNALDVRPATVELRFARVDSRTIPVTLRLNDLLGADWAVVDSLTVDPATVRLSGPPARVAALTGLATEIVDLVPEDTVFERVVPLDTSGLQGLALSTRSVRVTGRLDRVVSRLFTSVPIDIGSGITVDPERVDVTVRGRSRLVQRLSPSALRVVVAIDSIPEQIPEEGMAVPLRVDALPLGLTATLDPLEARLSPRLAPLDTTPGAEFPAPGGGPPAAGSPPPRK